VTTEAAVAAAPIFAPHFVQKAVEPPKAAPHCGHVGAGGCGAAAATGTATVAAASPIFVPHFVQKAVEPLKTAAHFGHTGAGAGWNTGAGAAAPTFAPQALQKADPGGNEAPQLVQNCLAVTGAGTALRLLPHFRQNI
jgi:hypothetical protein